MSKHIEITHADVQRALSKFMDEGGLIRKLPNTPDVRSSRVNETQGSSKELIERIRTLGFVGRAD
jgi:DNA-binding MarR family transcriptional regulator